MVGVTKQQLDRYYDTFREVDVIFTKEVIKTVRLVPKRAYLKHLGHQIPCVIYSSSMSGAKIIANVRADTFSQSRNGKNLVSLHLGFLQSDKHDPLSFYVTSKIAGFRPWGTEGEGLNFVSLTFPQRPPDDLIAVLGNLLETNVTSKKRREERIVVTDDNVLKLGLKSGEALVYVQNVPRKCVIRDLSFSGTRLIIPGLAKFLLQKPATLQFEIEDALEPVRISGTVIRIEQIADRQDIGAIAIVFDEGSVPLVYKMHLSEYLKTKNRNPRDAAAIG